MVGGEDRFLCFDAFLDMESCPGGTGRRACALLRLSTGNIPSYRRTYQSRKLQSHQSSAAAKHAAVVLVTRLKVEPDADVEVQPDRELRQWPAGGHG